MVLEEGAEVEEGAGLREVYGIDPENADERKIMADMLLARQTTFASKL